MAGIGGASRTIGRPLPQHNNHAHEQSGDRRGNHHQTDKYRAQIAEALLAGVLQYQQALKKTATVATR